MILHTPYAGRKSDVSPPRAGNLLSLCFFGSRRVGHLRSEYIGNVSPSRWLRRPYSARREAGRFAISTTYDLPASDQPQDRQGNGPHRPADAARQRRRGDRIGLSTSGVGTKRTCRSILAMSVVG